MAKQVSVCRFSTISSMVGGIYCYEMQTNQPPLLNFPDQTDTGLALEPILDAGNYVIAWSGTIRMELTKAGILP